MTHFEIKALISRRWKKIMIHCINKSIKKPVIFQFLSRAATAGTTAIITGLLHACGASSYGCLTAVTIIHIGTS